MKVRELARISALASLLFIIYHCGSLVLYVELFNFTVLLYGISLPKRQAILCLLIVLVYGAQPWTLMYVLIFPTYAIIYHLIGRRLRSEYVVACLGFLGAFLSGTLIDLPFIFLSGMTGRALGIHLLLGFQTSVGNGVSTFLATIFLLPILSKVMKRV